jgi:hypothetical protein
MGLTFEKVWAMFQETDRKFQEIAEQSKETDRQFKETDRQIQETDRQIQETDRQFKEIAERSKETDRQFKEIAERSKETDRQFQAIAERSKETDRQFKETDRKISRLGNRLGELIEHLMAANIVEKFNRLGYAFGRASPNARFFNPRNELVAEVDILLENGDVALAVEVKSKLTTDDIAYHAGRMERLRGYADEHGDRRRLLGAVAGAIMSEGVKPFALKNGFYVIEQSGDTATIAVPEGFVPKEW